MNASAATTNTIGTNNSVSIAKDSTVAATMKAKIHLVLSDATNSESMPLTTWHDDDPEGSHDWVLYTGGYLEGDTNANARLAKLGTQTQGYITYKVSAWLEDTSSSDEKSTTGHQAAWKQSIAAASTAGTSEKTFTFAYDSTTAIAEGKTRLASGDTKFYFEEDENTVNAISKTLEEAAESVRSVDVDANDLVTNYSEYENSGTQPMLQLGYLFVRAEGKNTDHGTGDYVLTLKVTGNADEV